ncbi:MAG: NADP-dependent oxidoreductase [Actinomycetota bacterium]|nr:NADP-dependent oxidoreductase [Actinomycetota bacterium]
MTTTDQHLPEHMRAVRFDGYGGVDVLDIRDVPVPEPTEGRVLVRVRATGINPGEMSIREGYMHERFPATFPSGEGSDLAGEVVAAGPGVTGFAPGDEVLGWSDERSAHAEYVTVPATQLARRPDGLSVEQAGSLYVVGATAVAAVRAVDPQPGETVVISGAAGGVGVLTTQLAVATGATVIGIAGEANHAWLRDRGAVPVSYGDGMVERIRAAAPDGVDALIDLFGGGYVALALDELGVKPDRVNTIIDFATAAERGVTTEGNAEGADIANLVDLGERIAAGELELPIAATYPLVEVRAAYTELARRHTHGKIVLLP